MDLKLHTVKLKYRLMEIRYKNFYFRLRGKWWFFLFEGFGFGFYFFELAELAFTKPDSQVFCL